VPDLEPVAADDELLSRSARGDSSAFEQFLTRHERWLTRFAGAMAGGDVEDVVQDAFVAAWRGAAGFRGGDARAWLAVIARNAAHARFRRRAGEPPVHETLDSSEDLARAAGWGVDGPDVEFERLATREAVAAAFERLPVEDREVLMLRDVEGFSGDETAATLGVSLSAMKSRLHRARLRLAASLREAFDGRS
jgi:RNA polymerase sigma-70 factor (ECF subfamily)